MIGLVVAAGTGRRLRPETDQLPKTLLPVDGEVTILDIGLRNLASAGLADVVVIVGYAAGAIADQVPDLERRHGLAIDLVYNDRAGQWDSAYSLWLAREHFGAGALLVNGDTVHPVSVARALLAARKPELPTDVILAMDTASNLTGEEMKVAADERGLLGRISRQLDRSQSDGAYMGAALIEARAAVALADSLEACWRRNPDLCYEDGFQELADRGGAVALQPAGGADWVDVDDHNDLRRAREIVGRS